MNTYLAIFLTAMCGTLFLTPIVRRVSERFGWLDNHLRDERRVHSKPVPRLGGVAIYLVVIFTLGLLPLINNLTTQNLRQANLRLLTTLVPATLLFLFGVYDDLRSANARLKFTAQILAGVMFYFMGGRIDAVTVPFVGSVALPYIVGLFLTVLWTVGVSNAFNLIDGMDGLASGAALFASLVMLVVSVVLGNPLVTILTLALSGALIGFLRYNFNPASIFLGDSGSLFVGFMLAALSVQGMQKASTIVAVTIPLLAFGVPVIDTGFTLLRRFISGRPLFEGDREHIHHMLLARGWSQRRVAVVLYGVCALFSLLALLFVSDASGRAIGLLLVIVGAAVIFAVGRLRYHEVDEIKASMKRNLSLPRRHLRATNNVRIRRASQAMARATTINQLLDALGELLDVGEFVYATVQLGRGGDEEHNRLAFERERGTLTERGVEIRAGLIYWSWERNDIDVTNLLGTGRFWTLRLPLSTAHAGWGYLNLYREFDSAALLLDINYICNVFQRQMAETAGRVLLASAHDSTENVLALSAVGR